MNRCVSACLLVTAFLFVQDLEALKAAEKPNILWIIAEDMGPELSCYGTPEVKTPTLDRLAQKGMLFNKAFTVTPVCSTSRSSFMTGMYAMSIDAHNHRSHREGTNPLPDGVRVLTDWLRPAGYTTGNIKRLTKDRKLAKFYKGTGKTDWNFTYPKGKKPFDVNDWDELKNQQPFYAQINFSETHRGGAWNTSHEHIGYQADPAKVKIPDYYPDHPVTRGVWAQYLNAVMAVDKKVAFILDLLKRDKLDKNTIVIFFGDHGRAMPRGKQWPYDSGLHIPLIVYWPEGDDTLPAPKNFKRGEKSDQLIASIDLSTTTLALAGITKPTKMQGQVFLGGQSAAPREYLFAGRDRGDETVLHIRTVRDQRYRYLRNKYTDHPFLQINRYKETNYPIIGLMRHLHAEGKLTGPPLQLMADSRPEEELYDLENDPWETNNLAGSAEHQGIKNQLVRVLNHWIKEIDDKGQIPEDPSIPKFWDDRSIRNYTKRMESRPKDWFLSDPVLGPYRIKERRTP